MFKENYSLIDFINKTLGLKLFSDSKNSYEKLEENGLHISLNRNIDMIKENILTPLFLKDFLKDNSKREKIEKYCKITINKNGNISVICLSDLLKVADIKDKEINANDLIIPLELL
ncbi:MAG TPA: hypothetical protein DDW20_06005 [Firmicutes bacterium]|nr:hypothetical protein [Bacillota bacterium]